MEFSGEREVAAPKQSVYDALNDPTILQQCIPGCESLERTSDNGFSAKVGLKVGPVRAKFSGDVALEDLNPPNSYSLVGKGKGGPAGFASGRAAVTLDESGSGTLLSYKVDVEIGGKIAQLGSRLINGTANKLSGEFFDEFCNLTEERARSANEAEPATLTSAPEAEPATASQIPQPEKGTAAKNPQQWVWWAVGGTAAVVAMAVMLG